MSWRDDPYSERDYQQRREQLIRAGWDSDAALAKAQSDFREAGLRWRVIVRVAFVLLVAFLAASLASSLFESPLVKWLIAVPVSILAFGLALNFQHWFRLRTGRR